MEDVQGLEEQKWCTYMLVVAIAHPTTKKARLIVTGSREPTLPLYFLLRHTIPHM